MRMWSQVQVVEERHERVACAVSGGDSDALLAPALCLQFHEKIQQFTAWDCLRSSYQWHIIDRNRHVQISAMCPFAAMTDEPPTSYGATA